MEKKEVIIIGGGPAGLAAAVRLYEKGVRDILILEREHNLGGILRQCIHDGFGLTRFGETLSGPEYADRFVQQVQALGIPCRTDTTVLDIHTEADGSKTVYAAGKKGYLMLSAKAVILSMGCRERTRGALAIPGERPSGIYTAGVAQSYINLRNRMPGKEVVILGSGDIGLIMARRLTLEGAHVHGVFEVQPYPSGLARNIEQCLHDYDIPLSLSHTVTDIKGKERLEAVVISAVDEKMQPIPGTEQEYPCDTLILSVGLIPENELSLAAGVALDPGTKGAIVDEHHETTVPGIFAAGNVLHVHDLVDFVSMEAEDMADAVCAYVKGELGAQSANAVGSKDGSVLQIVPQRCSGEEDFTLYFRVRRPMKNCTLEVWQGDVLVASVKKPKALPAEMVQLKIKKEKLTGKGGLEVKAVC